MDYPQYVNAFVFSVNSELKEVIIKFSQSYPAFPDVVSRSGVSVEKAQTDICNIVLPETVARQLIENLSAVFQAIDEKTVNDVESVEMA